MTALEAYKESWRRIVYDATGDNSKALRAIELAEINGMFDPIKALLEMGAVATEFIKSTAK